jgi:hypothetical protein
MDEEFHIDPSLFNADAHDWDIDPILDEDDMSFFDDEDDREHDFEHDDLESSLFDDDF